MFGTDKILDFRLVQKATLSLETHDKCLWKAHARSSLLGERNTVRYELLGDIENR